MSLKAGQEAHAGGYAENLYLDAKYYSYVEETGGANILFVNKEGQLIVPQSVSDSILPSVTRRSLIVVARDILGLDVIERPVAWKEVQMGAFKECGLCGTAAVISPISQIDSDAESVVFPDCKEGSGPIMAKLRKTLVDIQAGEIEGPEGWVVPIC